MASLATVSASLERPADAPTSTRPRKRKRPRVPDEQRQRSTVACSSCRRLKEKCDGNTPCSRCLRVGRPCEPAPALPASRPVPANLSQEPSGQGDHLPRDERMRHLEYIAKHFLGDIPLTEEYLRRIVQNLQSGNAAANSRTQSESDEAVVLDEERFTVKPLSRNTAHYSGELSHWNFSQRVKRQADQRLQGQTSRGDENNARIFEYWRASELKSRNARLQSMTNILPPKEVALFLARIFFSYAQTNTFFVEESWIIENIEKLYSGSLYLSADDSTWLCTTISVLAVATQFADMSERDSLQSPAEQDISKKAADAAGISLYHMAADLVPDIITIASVESVQACLLLAHFALPLDTQGLTYSYLGLALRMAVQNGMHRKYIDSDLDPSTVAFRNRLWWTVYRLEKRISILHGRPISIASSEVDADYPSDDILVQSLGHESIRLENTMTKITDWLGDFAFVIHMLRKCPSRLRQAYFERLMLIRQKYLHWWRQVQLLEPTANISRSVAHIYLAHDVNIIFLGRPFIFGQSQATTTEASSNKRQSHPANSKRIELVDDAVGSAKHVLQICGLLHSSVGLAKSSYMEFSSCRAAVLVLLAQSLNDPSRQLRDAVKEGMSYINQMASANQSTRSEASVMAAIESQLRELDARRQGTIEETSDDGHLRSLATFKHWAAQFQETGPTIPTAPVAGPSPPVPPDSFDIQDAFEAFWSPFDATIADTTPNTNECDEVALHHFEDVFSIANLAQNNSDS